MEPRVCPNCGEENPPKFRMCGYCGTPLDAPPAQKLRKTVTIIFSDLQGSTSLGERVDSEALHEIKSRYFAAMAAVLEYHGGKIEKYIGDAIMAVFGLPRIREDDALRAVRAAFGMQEELARVNAELQVAYGITLAARIGVNTGEVLANSDPNADQRLADGDAVNVAARLEQAAPPMEVFIGEVTRQLVRDEVTVEPVEPLTLKGKAELVSAYRLVSVRSSADRMDPLRDGPLIGREAEIALLNDEFASVAATDGVRLVTVVGDPGVGKSRLISEFVETVAYRATILRGRCLPYGDGITFWPIVGIARGAAGILEDDASDVARAKLGELIPDGLDRDGIVDRVASAIGLVTTSYPVSELFWGIRRMLEAIAVSRPVVVVVDDIHAAETTFVELLEHLVDSGDAPILLVATARHELLDDRPAWGAGAARRLVLLEALSRADTDAMIERVLGDTGLNRSIPRRIADAAEGNPLFVEQMISMLIDQGALAQEGARWVAVGEVGDVAIPPTMHALIAARLDHLSADERAVVEPASVIGVAFPEQALEELVPDPLRPAVGHHLAVLDRKHFVHPAEEEDATHRFHHQLIRDTAYNSLLKRNRAQLHERFVDWAERVNRERDRETEFEEILGYHLEQAYRYRADLGPIDDEGREIALRAARKLAWAGRRASARGDMPAAVNLLSRAANLVAVGDALWRDVAPELADALIEVGDFGGTQVVLAEAARVAEESRDELLEARAALQRQMLDLYRSASTSETTIAETERAIAIFERIGDEAWQARAWGLATMSHGTVGRFEEATAAAERFARHATRAGDVRLAAQGASAYATVALLGPSPVPEVIATCEQLMAQVGDDRKAVGVISGVLAVLKAMEGSFDEARSLYANARHLLEELGRSVTAASTSTESSRVEMLAGNYAAAEAELRLDYEALGAMGETYFRSTVAGYLSQALVAQGRLDEAHEFAQTTRELAAPDDTVSQALWRSTAARVAATRGRAEEAIELAEEALRLVEETPSPTLIADAKADLGDVLAALGQFESAVSAWTEALLLYEGKGDRASAGRVRDRLARPDTSRVTSGS